jgi:IS1 family transposase
VWISPNTKTKAFELDEVYWFIGKRKGYENGINTYVMTMLSREPRQIVAFSVDNSVTAANIQRMTDMSPEARNYYTDGGQCYLGVDFLGKHRRNTRDKSDTHDIESSNADLRHYIPGLARRSRCFFRSMETLEAVISVFVDAYNKFGEAKLKHRVPTQHKPNHAKHLHKYREVGFSILDFL